MAADDRVGEAPSPGGHGRKPEAVRDRAVQALLTEPSLAAAAATAKVSVRCLRRWLKEPDFVSCYRSARRLVFEASIGRLQALAAEAVAALGRSLSCGDARCETRAA